MAHQSHQRDGVVVDDAADGSCTHCRRWCRCSCSRTAGHVGVVVADCFDGNCCWQHWCLVWDLDIRREAVAVAAVVVTAAVAVGAVACSG